MAAAANSATGSRPVDFFATVAKKKMPNPKAYRRLCTRAEFLRVQGGGRRFRGKTMALLVAPAHPHVRGAGRLGLTVRRKVGNAVVRNRVRRVLRACWQQPTVHPLAEIDHVIIAFPGAGTLRLADALGELECLLAKARAWVALRSCATRPLPCTG